MSNLELRSGNAKKARSWVQRGLGCLTFFVVILVVCG